MICLSTFKNKEFHTSEYEKYHHFIQWVMKEHFAEDANIALEIDLGIGPTDCHYEMCNLVKEMQMPYYDADPCGYMGYCMQEEADIQKQFFEKNDQIKIYWKWDVAKKNPSEIDYENFINHLKECFLNIFNEHHEHYEKYRNDIVVNNPSVNNAIITSFPRAFFVSLDINISDD